MRRRNVTINTSPSKLRFRTSCFFARPIPTHRIQRVPCPSLLRTPSRARGRATCGRSRVEARRRAHHCVEPSSHFQALAQARQGMPRCALHSRSSYVAAAATCFELEPILTLIPSLGLSPNPNPKPDPTPYAGRSRPGSSLPPAGARCPTGCTCSSARCRTCHQSCSTPPSKSSRSSPPPRTRRGSRSWQPYATESSSPRLAAPE